MDTAVLSVVIGKSVSARQLRKAIIIGFKRVYAAGVSYPVLLPDDRGLVEGIVFGPVRPNEAKALDAFEGENYTREIRPVTLETGEIIEALVYLPVGHVQMTDKAWNFDEWKRRHRAAYLQRVTRWMRPG